MVTEPKIGYWYTYCCDLDLKQIDTEEELANVIEDMTDDCFQPTIWATKEEALADIYSWGIDSSDKDSVEKKTRLSREIVSSGELHTKFYFGGRSGN